MSTRPLTLAILGVGLIGGAFGMALKAKLGDKIKIIGNTRTQASLDKAIALGAIDEGSLVPKHCVQDADIIYLSTPVLQMVPLLREIIPRLKPGTIITDAGSTKSYIARKIMELLPPEIEYVAGHPMTGREKSGVEAAHKDLFKQKCYVLVKDTGASEAAIAKITELIRLTEANITTISLAEHDYCASLISHVPHLTAAALVHLLERNPDKMDSAINLAGGGFKDTTRIASSNADMWADICMSNQEPLLAHLDQLQTVLQELATAIQQQDRDKLHQYFTVAKTRRDKILEDTKDKYELI